MTTWNVVLTSLFFRRPLMFEPFFGVYPVVPYPRLWFELFQRLAQPLGLRYLLRGIPISVW